MKRDLLILITALAVVLGIAACGGQKESAQKPAPAATTSAATQESPADLGSAMGRVYQDSLGKVVALLKDRPEPALVKPRVVELKDAAIRELVAMGRKREALGPGDREAVDSSLRVGLNLTPSEVYTAFQEAHKFYFSKDLELANLISSFNIITQYANFDLLEKQAPAEAGRLGLTK